MYKKTILLFWGTALFVACTPNKQISLAVDRRDAFWKQVDSVVEMLEDTTQTADNLCQPLRRLSDTVSGIINSCPDFAFVKEVQGLGRRWAYLLMLDKREIDFSCWEDLLVSSYYWTVHKDDTMASMVTSMFRSSSEMNSRYATIMIKASLATEGVMLLVVDQIDILIQDIQLSLFDSDGNVFKTLEGSDGQYAEECMEDDGMVMIRYDLEQVVPFMREASVLKLSYKTPSETIEMLHPMLPTDSIDQYLQWFER